MIKCGKLKNKTAFLINDFKILLNQNMKNTLNLINLKILLWFFFFSMAFSQESRAQAPGYQGKRIFLTYSINKTFFPRGNNRDNWAKLNHNFELAYALNRRIAVGFNYNPYNLLLSSRKDAFNYALPAIVNTPSSHTQYFGMAQDNKIKVRELGIFINFYNGRRYAAPLGFEHQIALHRTTFKLDENLKSLDLEDFDGVQISIPIEEKYSAGWALAYKIAYNFVVKNQIILKPNFELVYPFGKKIIREEIRNFFNGTSNTTTLNNFIEDHGNLRIHSYNFLSFGFGIGILLNEQTLIKKLKP